MNSWSKMNYETNSSDWGRPSPIDEKMEMEQQKDEEKYEDAVEDEAETEEENGRQEAGLDGREHVLDVLARDHRDRGERGDVADQERDHALEEPQRRPQGLVDDLVLGTRPREIGRAHV